MQITFHRSVVLLKKISGFMPGPKDYDVEDSFRHHKLQPEDLVSFDVSFGFHHGEGDDLVFVDLTIVNSHRASLGGIGFVFNQNQFPLKPRETEKPSWLVVPGE